MFWNRNKNLSDILFQTHRLKVHGVIFKVRKLNPIDFISGAKALQMHFQTYEKANQVDRVDLLLDNKDKIEKHYKDVIMAAVIEPALSYKEGEEGKIWVDNLFTDWGLVNELYERIMLLTYGKKKEK